MLMSAEVKAFISAILASVAAYLILTNLNLQFPGNFQLPTYTNFIFGILFGVVVFAIMLEVFKE
jgi:hypothetical protein